MRLIDADELKKDDEVILWLSKDAVRTGKTLKMFSELFVKKIDKQPTIQAVPIDVLDKIRDEIEFKSRIVLKDTPKHDWTVKWNECIKEVLEIIDKYKEESEVNCSADSD